MFGKHIKRFHLTDHIAPSKLQVMLKFCKNVIHLSLPSFDYKNIGKIVSSTASLQIVDILGPKFDHRCNDSKRFIQQIFMSFHNLKELSLHFGSLPKLLHYLLLWLEEWANFNYVPRKLNIVFNGNYLHSISTTLQSCVSILRSKTLPKNFESGHIAWFNICFKRSKDFSPVVPTLQLQVTTV